MPRHADPKKQRQRIAESAFRVLARDGLEGFAMRKVAKEAGCTIGLINHWFSSKDELVVAAWNEALARENARHAQFLARPGATVEDLLAASLPVNEALRQEALVWIAFSALTVSNRKVREKYRRRFDYAQEAIAGLLRNGATRVGRKQQTAEIMLAGLEGVVKMAALNPKRWPAHRQRRVLKSILEPLLSSQ